MKFIDTTEGLINASIVTSITRIKPKCVDGHPMCTHLVRYGEHLTAYTWEAEREALVTEIIPAAPGYSVLQGYDDDGSTFSDDIIAWRIHRTMDSVPITVDGAVEGDCAILDPSGAVSVPYVCRFDTRADFDQYAAEEWRKRQEASKLPAKRPELALKKSAEVAA